MTLHVSKPLSQHDRFYPIMSHTGRADPVQKSQCGSRNLHASLLSGQRSAPQSALSGFCHLVKASTVELTSDQPTSDSRSPTTIWVRSQVAQRRRRRRRWRRTGGEGTWNRASPKKIFQLRAVWDTKQSGL